MDHFKQPDVAGVMGLALTTGSVYALFATKAAIHSSLPPWAAATCLIIGFSFLLCCLARYIYRFKQEVRSDAMKNQRFRLDSNHKEKKRARKQASRSCEHTAIGTIEITDDDSEIMNTLFPVNSKKVKKSKTMVNSEGMIP